ncbi:hypothetical protein EI94DRAFT_1704851 [Lactarius quietus]|nr:hypothetical protein EI94DRAFT_1704851 [Lactarius quietus]
MGNERLTDNQGATFEDDDPKFAALLAESDLSGSEYKGSGGPESETESDEEPATGSEGPELENEEPDTKIQVKAGKKPKKGLIARDQISAAVAAISAEPSPSPSLDRGKITAGSKRGPSSKPAKSSHPRSGLVPNWQQVQRIQTQTEAAASVLPRKSSGISVTGSEIDSDTITCNTGTGSQHGSLVDRPLSRAASSDADASYGYGGFAPDDEVLYASHILTVGPKSITKIQDIHSMPSPRTNRLATNKCQAQKKKEISYESLPMGTKNDFKRKILPIALDTTGALKPWNTPCDDTIIEIWNLVFGADHPLDDGDTDCYRFIVAKTLIKRAISSWIHKFADTAEKALIIEFTQQGLQTQEERAAFVQKLLGDTDDMSDKKRPFIWESAYDDPSAQQEVTFQFVGIFQGRLVARTFFEHIQVINTVNAEYRVQEKPIGALIYSIQAVCFVSVSHSFKDCPNVRSGSSCPPVLHDWVVSAPYGEEKRRILKDQLG